MDRRWSPFAYQRDVWERYLAHESGLIHAATGTGKTLAAWMGPLAEAVAEGAGGPEPLRVLWITPLRALAADTEQALKRPVEDLGLSWTVERRTGDTGYSVKKRQREQLPTALVTTPESVSLLISYPGMREQFAGLRCVIVDEWHELLGTKRGTMTELVLARLRRWAPQMRTWGVSATLGNLEEARHALLGIEGEGTIVESIERKSVVVDSLLPPTVERFPWAGHMAMTLLDQVVEAIEGSATTLVFVNTRRQAEKWFQALLEARPDWAGHLALHHGSLARATRRFVERGIKEGRLRAVVATSSLDLGVDFPPVDRVLQIGSPKGIGRLLQRAGRSGHRPGEVSRVTVVPTHAFELLEAAAAREAGAERRVEPRRPLEKPLDLLAQHLLTVALGEPFEAGELLHEVRSTCGYHNLTDEEWSWVLDFAASGGPALRAYPEFARLMEREGRWTITTNDVARRHRLTVGVIVSDAAVEVKYRRGPSLGSAPESFIARLEPGEAFYFGGKAVELVRVKDLTAYVRRARASQATLPVFPGGRMPLSTELGAAVRVQLDLARRGKLDSPELVALEPLLDLQKRWSTLPGPDDLLIERTRTRDGHHLFIFPFEGRFVHEGLAAVLALRMSRLKPISFSMSLNDYGIEMVSAEEPPLERALAEGLLDAANLEDDITEALNATEMARRQFREIARVAGLVFTGFPGQGRSVRQLQMSSGLLFDVFTRHDPTNLLLEQARREVLHESLQIDRMRDALDRITRGRILVVDTPRPTPLAFPVLVDRLRERISSERLEDRIRGMQLRLERAAT